MRDDLRQLLHLQSLDTRMAECLAEKEARFSELELLDKKLQASIKESEQEKERCQRGKVTLQDLEQEAAAKRGKIEKLRQQSGMIRNNREYQAAMHEIAGFESDISLIEDKMIEAMELIEQEQETLAGIEEDIVRARQKLAEEKEIVAREVAALDEEAARLKKDRAAVAEDLDAEVLPRYERIYGGRGGRAVVPVVDGACQGCYMQLTPQMANDVLKDDRIYFCENCGRFLYLAEPNPAVEQA